MTKRKSFENSILERSLVERISGFGENRAVISTITAPRRYLKNWQKLGVFAKRVKIVPIGGGDADFGFLVLPTGSPLLCSPLFEAEVKHFEAHLGGLIQR